MRGIKKGLLTAAAAMVFVLSCSLFAFADTAYVSTEGGSVNLRAEASTDSDILSSLANGTEVEVLGTDGDWTQVSVDGYTGYIMSTYLSSASDDSTDETAETVAGDGTVTLNDVVYTVSSDITDDMIPADYATTNIDYDGNAYTGLSNSSLGLDLLYLVSDSYSGLFIYDAEDDSFIPFINIGSDEHNVTVLEIPATFNTPEGYMSVSISTDTTHILTGYQLTDPGSFDDANIFIVYGISNNGLKTWYQIDTDENTYIRTATPEDIVSEDDASADASSTTDSDKLTQYKRYLMILAVICLVFLIIIINLLLFYRRGEYIDDDEDYDDDGDEDDDSYYDRILEKQAQQEAQPQVKQAQPQRTKKAEVDVPDISKLVDDTTAEALGYDTQPVPQPTQEKTAFTFPQEEKKPAESEELEFFDLDDL